MSNNNVKAEIIKGTSKNGNAYTGIQFSIMTSQGEYKSPLIFPTNLEIKLISDAINPMRPVYSEDTSSKFEEF